MAYGSGCILALLASALSLFLRAAEFSGIDAYSADASACFWTFRVEKGLCMENH